MLRDLIRRECGIHLTPAKKALLANRLGKRLRALSFADYRQYYDYVTSPAGQQEEKAVMLDCITTNQTEFFREAHHWRFLRDTFWPRTFAAAAGRTVRIWSAACSSGEEAYSILLSYLKHAPPDPAWQLELLASDLSRRMLARAREGIYPAAKVARLPADALARHFTALGDAYQVDARLRAMVRFERINLAQPFDWLHRPFDAIFCRNVIIYFDRETQREVLARMRQALVPGGCLFLGHAETPGGVDSGFELLAPTIYRKKG